MSAPPARPEQQAPSKQLELALEWARLHPCPANETPAHWGEADLHDERPGPARRSRCSVGRGVRTRRPGRRARDHPRRRPAADRRRPRARPPAPAAVELVLAGEVPVWRARLIARETTDLSVEAALFADRLIAATPTRIGQVQAARLVQEARLYFDPDRAIADEEEALTKRGVWLRHGGAPATTDVHDDPGHPRRRCSSTRPSPGSPGDLKELGDTEDLDVRRARAVGILADPQHALDLLSGREAAARQAHRAGATNLYVHLTPADLEATSPAAPVLPRSRSSAPPPPSCSPTGSPGSQQPAPRSPCARSSTSTPTGPWTSTTHPTRCARPWSCATPTASSPAAAATPGPATSTTSPSTSRWRTADHRAKPGPANLAPLCRTHHRVKTHTAWHYKRLDDGSYVWTAPTGHQYTSPVPRLTRRADRPNAVVSVPWCWRHWPLVSSDRSLRSLLDHQWLLPHASSYGQHPVVEERAPASVSKPPSPVVAEASRPTAPGLV